jgi:tetratricopeptide (TPR) repeat protein
MRGDAARALPLFDRALALAADQPALADLRLMLLVNRAVALSDLDRYQEAIAAVMQARTLAAEAGNRVRLAQADSVLVELLFDIGRWDAALRQVDGSSRDSADPTVQCCDHGVAAVIRLHRSDAAARRHLTDAEPFALRLGSRLIGSLVLARALDHEQAGAYNEALAVLYAGISAAASEVSEITGLLADAVRLAVVVGKRPLAEHLAGLARDCDTPDAPHRHAVSYHCRGLLDSDPTCLAHAAQEYLRAHRLLPCAQALEAAGTAAAERNDPGRARQYRANALSVYQVLHAGWDVGRLSGEWRQAA